MVGKVADHARDLARAARLGAGESGEAALDQGVEVEGENVSFDDFDVALLRVLHAQLSGKDAVEFDGDEFARAAREQLGQGAFARADLEHGFIAQVAESGDDLLRGVLVSEEILAELGLTQGDKFFSRFLSQEALVKTLQNFYSNRRAHFLIGGSFSFSHALTSS